jgi:hypothetical protein
VASIVTTEDNPEEFPGLRLAQLESFQATDEFVEAWSAADHHDMEEERCRRLGLVINLDDDDTGQSSRPCGRHGDAGQGCSYLLQPKEEPNDEEDNYARAWRQRRRLLVFRSFLMSMFSNLYKY